MPVAFAPERGTLLVTADGSPHLPELFTQVEDHEQRIAFITALDSMATRPVIPGGKPGAKMGGDGLFQRR